MKLNLFLEQGRKAFAKKKKRLKRKAFLLKVKIFLTCVLPALIILLTAKVVQTLARTQLRKAAGRYAADREGDMGKKRRESGRS